ncbi:D-glucuronyl C5-epimerase family protein [bacterium]|nr:D-glucuronyl C5-epimerase family protein [bacterium]
MNRFFRRTRIVFWFIVIAPVLAIGAVLALYFKNDTRRKVTPIRLDYLGTDKLGPYYLNPATIEELSTEPVWAETDGRRWLHPVRTCHVANKHYRQYLDTGNEVYRTHFLKLTETLIEHADEDRSALIWPYPISYYPDQQVPWISSMAQGLVIAVLARAYETTRDDRYLELARRTMLTFERDVRDGGVRYEAARGVFYEEYAFVEENKQHHTLNGMLAALFGLYDLHKVCGDEHAKELFDQGVKAIRDNLPAFDLHFLSSYDLRHEYGEPPLFLSRYHQMHVGQLTILAEMTGDPYFQGVADVWDRKLFDPINRLRLTAWYAGYLYRDIRNRIDEKGVKGVAKRLADRALSRVRDLSRARPHDHLPWT